MSNSAKSMTLCNPLKTAFSSTAGTWLGTRVSQQGRQTFLPVRSKHFPARQLKSELLLPCRAHTQGFGPYLHPRISTSDTLSRHLLPADLSRVPSLHPKAEPRDTRILCTLFPQRLAQRGQVSNNPGRGCDREGRGC